MNGSHGWQRTATAAYFGLPAIAIAALSANADLTMFSVASLVAIVLLVWRAGEAPILLFVCFMQWLQGSLKLLQADLMGLPLQSLAESRNCENATALTIGWSLVLALGMRLVLMKEPTAKATLGIESLKPGELLPMYLAWTVFLQVIGPFAQGGFRQIAVALAEVRWAIVFAIFWSVLSNKRDYALLGAVFVVEVAFGFLSYFSSFKTPIYLLALALPAGRYAFRLRHIVGVLLIAGFALYLGIIWSSIKSEYRDSIDSGTLQAGREAQAQELLRLLGAVDAQTLEDGAVQLVERIAYVDYFAMTLDFVPAMRDHENGLLWGNAVRHVLTPRLFFPDKSALESDTVIAERYTGVRLTLSRNTSIALGTPAETYVDFGRWWMFLPAFCLGILYALIYRGFAAYGAGVALAQGLAVTLLLSLGTVELTPSKLVGGLLMRLVVAVLVWQGLLQFGRRMRRRETAAVVRSAMESR